MAIQPELEGSRTSKAAQVDHRRIAHRLARPTAADGTALCQIGGERLAVGWGAPYAAAGRQRAGARDLRRLPAGAEHTHHLRIRRTSTGRRRRSSRRPAASSGSSSPAAPSAPASRHRTGGTRACGAGCRRRACHSAGRRRPGDSRGSLRTHRAAERRVRRPRDGTCATGAQLPRPPLAPRRPGSHAVARNRWRSAASPWHVAPAPLFWLQRVSRSGSPIEHGTEDTAAARRGRTPRARWSAGSPDEPRPHPRSRRSVCVTRRSVSGEPERSTSASCCGERHSRPTELRDRSWAMPTMAASGSRACSSRHTRSHCSSSAAVASSRRASRVAAIWLGPTPDAVAHHRSSRRSDSSKASAHRRSARPVLRQHAANLIENVSRGGRRRRHLAKGRDRQIRSLGQESGARPSRTWISPVPNGHVTQRAHRHNNASEHAVQPRARRSPSGPAVALGGVAVPGRAPQPEPSSRPGTGRNWNQPKLAIGPGFRRPVAEEQYARTSRYTTAHCCQDTHQF